MMTKKSARQSGVSGLFILFLTITSGMYESRAATVALSDTLDTESSSFSPANPLGIPSRSSATIETTGSASPFVVQFSSLGETVVSYTWQAPVGKRFVVRPPVGGSSVFAQLLYEVGSRTTFAGSIADNSPLVEFAGAGGSVSVSSARVFLTGPNTGFNPDTFSSRIEFDLTPGQSFYFESATITTTVPASYTTDFNVTSTESNFNGQAFGLPSSPGQWITLEDVPGPTIVPEPRMSLLLALSVLGFAAVRRRL